MLSDLPIADSFQRFDLPLWIAILVNLSVTAFIFSLILTQLTRRYAQRLNFVDHPDGRRKTQANPIALGGGLAIFLASAMALGLTAMLNHGRSSFSGNWLWLAGLLGASAWLCLIGLIDDKIHIRGRHKLLAQLVAAIAVMATGARIDYLSVFGSSIELGLLAYPLTAFWLIGAINSLNLIDGMDGLAGSVGVIFGVAFGLVAIYFHNIAAACVAFAMAGALVGFLRFNLPPASIYMGDAGSMVIGLALGTIALMCQFKGSATMAMMVPLAIWAVPILDSLAALLRRKLTGRSMYATDRGHLHHVLQHRGYSSRQTLLFIVILCSITAAGALSSVFLQREWIAPVTVVSLISLLIFSRSFGHIEAKLIGTHLAQIVGRIPADSKVIEHSIHLQGNREWKTIWSALTESGERFELAFIKLNLHLPQVHEGFYASWKRRGDLESEHCWQAELPISLNGQVVGRLQVAGLPDSRSASVHISQFLDFVEPFEAGLAALVSAQTDPNSAGAATASESTVISAGAQGLADTVAVKRQPQLQPQGVALSTADR